MDKSEHDRYHRWRTSLHEGGHAIAAEVLGAVARDAVMLLEGDHMRNFHDPCNLYAANGCATYGATVGEFPTAIIAAAGHAAESLADAYPPPPMPETTLNDEEETPAESPRTPEHTAAVEGMRVDQLRILHDDMVIALYAINKDLQHPDVWAPAVARVRGEAASIVKQYADTVVRVATTLFLQGYITPEEMRVLLDGIAPQPTVEECA